MKNQRAREILREKKPQVEDYKNFSNYLIMSDTREKAKDALIAEKYNFVEARKILKLSDALTFMQSDNENITDDEYTTKYNKSRNKANKIISSSVLKKELKIKALEQEIRELSIFSTEMRNGDFSCLRIGLGFRVEEEAKKEVA